MSLENIRQSERSQPQMTAYNMNLFIRNAQKREIYKTERKLLVACEEGEEECWRIREVIAKTHGVSSGGNENVLKLW